MQQSVHGALHINCLIFMRLCKGWRFNKMPWDVPALIEL
jgi:hypothetical protein